MDQYGDYQAVIGRSDNEANYEGSVTAWMVCECVGVVCVRVCIHMNGHNYINCNHAV